MHWFDYSIIRYLPNPKRGEVINIGLIVFRASGVDVRVLNTSAKARIIDGTTEYDDVLAIESMYQEIAEHIESPEKQYLTIKSFSSGVFISEKNSFSVSEIGQYEARVNQLFNDLVKPFSSQTRTLGHSRFYTLLKNKFKHMDILAKDVNEIDDHKIVANFPLDSGSGLAADFMIKNGKYHMSEVIDFNVNDTKAKFKETTMKVMTFVEGRKSLGSKEVGCYFVYSASNEKEKEVMQHLSLASDYSDRAFNLDSKQDESSYFQLIADITGAQLNLGAVRH